MASKFWTEEMIERAIPKIKRKLPHANYRGVSTTATNGITTSVPDADRKKEPYQSVGVLVFTVGKSPNERPYHGTAYATNITGANNVVFTAAHNLVDEDGDSENILFIPAVQTDKSRPFGEFKQIDGKKGTAFFVHPKYDVKTAPDAYDLGAVKLQKNAAGKQLGDVVGLLGIAVNKFYTSIDSFKTIGYPETYHMQENTGKFKDKTDMNEVVNKYGALPEGSSGSPWLFKGNRVNGSTASGTPDLGEDSSPYFSTAKIDAITSQM